MNERQENKYLRKVALVMWGMFIVCLLLLVIKSCHAASDECNAETLGQCRVIKVQCPEGRVKPYYYTVIRCVKTTPEPSAFKYPRPTIHIYYSWEGSSGRYNSEKEALKALRVLKKEKRYLGKPLL